MLNEQTHQKLVAMKLHGLATAFQEYLDQPDPDALSFQERFGLMVDREWTDRQQRSLRRRLQVAKLRETACMEDIDYRHPRHMDRSVMQRLATCRYIEGHDNVIITGPTGIGKTWIGCALANQACRERYTAMYARLPRLLHDLQIARADGSYTKVLNRLERIDLLVLDDWGLGVMDQDQRRDVLEVMEDRYGRRSTVVSSQLPHTKWHEVIGDPTIADSILDRLVHRAHKIVLKGPSMRRKGRKGEA
jgi:DNA replication protein DnaC